MVLHILGIRAGLSPEHPRGLGFKSPVSRESVSSFLSRAGRGGNLLFFGRGGLGGHAAGAVRDRGWGVFSGVVLPAVSIVPLVGLLNISRTTTAPSGEGGRCVAAGPFPLREGFPLSPTFVSLTPPQ